MAKMRRTNVIIRKHLGEAGLFDFVMFPHTRYFKDVFGLWDGVAKRMVDLSKARSEIIWLQFKTGYTSRKDKRRMLVWCIGCSARGILAEYVNREVRITKLNWGKQKIHEECEKEITSQIFTKDELTNNWLEQKLQEERQCIREDVEKLEIMSYDEADGDAWLNRDDVLKAIRKPEVKNGC